MIPHRRRILDGLDGRALLDAVYAAPSEGVMASALARVASEALGGRGVQVLTYDADYEHGRVRVRHHGHANVSDDANAGFTALFEGLPAGFVKDSLQVLATTSRSSPIPSPPVVREYIRRVSARDLLSVNGWDGAGRGVFLAAHLPQVSALDEDEARMLTRVSTHAVAATRILGRHAPPIATLSADGKNVTGAALPSDVPLEAVVAAARRIARIRHASVGSARDGLARIPPRIDAQWSLVARFLLGGEEHVVLRRNPAPGAVAADLTPRERQVLALLDAGHHMKLIAYELGISYATVRVLAARARRRVNK